MSSRARSRTQALREAQARAAERERRRRRFVLIVGGAVAVALVVAIVLALVQAAGDDEPAQGGSSTSDSAIPANTTDGAIPVGDEEAPVTVEVYFDYMCPACGLFEQANGDELDRLLTEGTARIDLHPISFLDRASQGTEYSTRAANAIATVADGAPDAAWDFHQALYEAQPEEGSTGLSDEEIAAIARDAGVPGAVVARFADREYDGWVTSVTEQAFDSGVEGTPTVRINGEDYQGDLYTPGPLSAAIVQADKAAAASDGANE